MVKKSDASQQELFLRGETTPQEDVTSDNEITKERQGLVTRIKGFFDIGESKRSVQKQTELMGAYRDYHNMHAETEEALIHSVSTPQRLKNEYEQKDLDHAIAIKEKKKRLKELKHAVKRVDDEHEKEVERIKAETEAYRNTGKPLKQKEQKDSMSERERTIRSQVDKCMEEEIILEKLKEEKLAEIDADAAKRGLSQDEVDEKKDKIREIFERGVSEP